MRLVFLSTVGTSILSNVEGTVGAGRFDVSGLPSDLVGRLGRRELSRLGPGDPYQGTIRDMANMGDAFFKRVLDFVRANPEGASAELNTIITFLRDFPYRGFEELEFYFYPTDTGTSYFCASVITEYLRSFGGELMGRLGISTNVRVYDPIVIRGLGSDVNWFSNGLLELIDKFARLIVGKSRDGYKVVVNATAGFKPETAYIALIAQLVGAWRIIYMHESFRQVIELPSLPITIKEAYVEQVRRIGNEAPEHLLRQSGVDVDGLRDYGLVDVVDGVVRVREWVRKLLELLT